MITTANYPLRITTSLGPDELVLIAFKGKEEISQPFRFRLELLAVQPVPFQKLLGQNATVTLTLPDGGERYFSGIVSRIGQGSELAGPEGGLIRYRMELTAKLWLLSKRVQCAIFQGQSVPQILQSLLAGVNTAYQLHRTYQPREYCVQYQESDLTFASRLMEEEGIFYYFQHAADGHTLVITDNALASPQLSAQGPLIYDVTRGGVRDDMRVTAWTKSQRVCASQYTLRDQSFELPGHTLEAQQQVGDSVQVGTVQHPLRAAPVPSLEIYEATGGYAKRFDGINPNGAEQPQSLQMIFQENVRTAQLRMQEETVRNLWTRGESNCGYFLPGYQFALSRHFDGDGSYLLTEVRHEARWDPHAREEGRGYHYGNRFRCMPATLPYVPPRVTPRPRIHGSQTATVVAPSGETIYCDKYGRVKVQFPWDRQGQGNANSSCWIRVSQPWAGQGWGAIMIPRAGQEVVVTFLEGDPDRPLITGSVYNAEQMPPFTLPQNRLQSGIKTNNTASGFHGIGFNDQSGLELLHIRSQKDLILDANENQFHLTPNTHVSMVGSAQMTLVGGPNVQGLTTQGKPGQGGELESEKLFGFLPDTHDYNLGVYSIYAYGTYSLNVVGVNSTTIFPYRSETIIDPFSGIAAMCAAGGALKPFGKGSVLGDSHTLYTNETRTIFGDQLTFSNGFSLQSHGRSTPAIINLAKTDCSLNMGMLVCEGLGQWFDYNLWSDTSDALMGADLAAGITLSMSVKALLETNIGRLVGRIAGFCSQQSLRQPFSAAQRQLMDKRDAHLSKNVATYVVEKPTGVWLADALKENVLTGGALSCLTQKDQHFASATGNITVGACSGEVLLVGYTSALFLGKTSVLLTPNPVDSVARLSMQTGQIVLGNDKSARLSITNAEVKLAASDALYLSFDQQAQVANVKAVNGITFMVGEETSITMHSDRVTVRCGSSMLDMSPSAIKIQAASIDIAATASGSIKGIKVAIK